MLKPPPFLIGAVLLFWGWQTGFLLVAAVLALVLEGSRFTKLRWDFSNQDFARIWTFCALVFLAAAVYAFTSNEGPSDFRLFFQSPTFASEKGAGVATARTTAALFRWLPMIFFLFIAAQSYSTRGGVPLQTISLILRARWKGATGHLCSPQVATGAGHLYSSERIRWNQARPASDGRVGDAGQRGDPAHAL